MYVTNLGALPDVISERQQCQKEIQAKTDSWVETQYGIKNFTGLSRNFFGIDPQQTSLVLCRQIPSVRIEDIVCRITSDLLGYNLISLSFVDDTFSCENHEKKSYVHCRWADSGKKNIPFFRGERIVDGPLINYSGQPLSLITTSSHVPGRTVADFHFGLRASVFGSNDSLLDVSELHRCYTRTAGRKPEIVYSIQDGRAQKKSTADCDLEGAAFRPPSSWYYPLFFSWFLDGSMVMLETYDNELAQVSQAKVLFEQTMREIEAGVGVKPLVLKVPPLDEKMLALPKHVIASPDSLASIGEQFRGRVAGDSVQFMRDVAETVLTWRS